MSDMSDRERSRSPSRSPRRERSRSRSQSPRQERDMEEDDKKIKAFVGGLPWKIDDPDLRERMSCDFVPEGHEGCFFLYPGVSSLGGGFVLIYFSSPLPLSNA